MAEESNLGCFKIVYSWLLERAVTVVQENAVVGWEKNVKGTRLIKLVLT